jgi:hypothetical protein
VIDASVLTDLELRWSATVGLEISVSSTELRNSGRVHKELVVLAEAPILRAYVEIRRWHSFRKDRRSR